MFNYPDPFSLTLAEMCMSLFVKCFPLLVVLFSSYLLGPGCISSNSRHSDEVITRVFSVAPCRASGKKRVFLEGSDAKDCASVKE